MKIFSIIFSLLCILGAGGLAVVQIVKTIEFFKNRKKSKVDNTKQKLDN